MVGGKKIFDNVFHCILQSKIQLFVDRYLLIHQRLGRNALFRPGKWNMLRSEGQEAAELTELKSLLGMEGQRKFVSGFLTKHEEGEYFIEDLSARLPIDISSCDTADGLFTENCVVVAEGELMPGGQFRAAALGLPPAESRSESISALQGLDLFDGKGAAESTPPVAHNKNVEDDGDRIIFLSDVHLDDPKVLDNLRVIFKGFSSMETPPSMFVLFGNFQSFNANKSYVKLKKLKNNFTLLGRLVSEFPSIRNHSKLVLVPGPNDIGPGVSLPRPGIPAPIASGLLDVIPNAILASNPCRIRHKGSDIILFRSELQHKLRGLCILPPPMPPAGTAHKDAVAFFFDQVCSTILQESHLSPIPLDYQPIRWEFDHALWVYPNPHGLVLADSEPAARSIFDTCDCLNPGSLSLGTFGAWNPSLREMEMCDVDPNQESEHDEDDDNDDDDVVIMQDDALGNDEHENDGLEDDKLLETILE